MQQVGRNEKCPCGSGKKYKNCHAEMSEHPAPRGLIILGVAIAAVAAMGIVPGLMPERKSRAPKTSIPAPTASQQTAKPGSPQPAGPAPAGKVWSVEHGHWHDAVPQQASPGSIRIDGLPTTSPVPGAAPLAATTTSPAQSDVPRTLTPQPPGAVRAGKVWSPEHGHWHDAPATQ